MDKFSAMKAFVRVVEAGTFTKAADSLDVPKAQMTRYVQALEEELKIKLLNRTTRRVNVTPDGADYYERAVRLLDEVDELEASLSHAKASPKGRLRVDVTSTIANFLLIPALDDFCTRYPEIQLDLGISDRPVDIIGENVDCVFRVGKVSDPSLVARRVGDIKVVTCASTEYLQRFGTPQQPADLERPPHRCITYFARGSMRADYVLQRGEERIEMTPHSMIAVNEYGSMLTAALAGLGIGRAATFMFAPHAAAGRLHAVLPEWSGVSLPLFVVYPPNRHVSTKLRAFIDWSADLFARTLRN